MDSDQPFENNPGIMPGLFLLSNAVELVNFVKSTFIHHVIHFQSGKSVSTKFLQEVWTTESPVEFAFVGAVENCPI